MYGGLFKHACTITKIMTPFASEVCVTCCQAGLDASPCTRHRSLGWPYLQIQIKSHGWFTKFAGAGMHEVLSTMLTTLGVVNDKNLPGAEHPLRDDQ